MSQDGSARSDLPAGGQEELGGVHHSERMMADMMKMLANLTIQNQQLLQRHLQQQQQTAAAAGDREVQQRLGSFLKASDEGFVVGTACSGYL